VPGELVQWVRVGWYGNGLLKTNSMIPTANSFFSGMGLMDIGLMEAGVNVQQSLDLDAAAINSMKLNAHRFRHKVVHEDIRQTLVLNQPDSDVIVVTYPCTKYSAVADIHGARTGDELYLHAFRHIAIKQPEAFVAENVPGMKKFKVVMEAMTKLPQYYVTVICPVSTTNWLPQKRDRLIIIGTKRPFFIAQPVQCRTVTMKDIIEDDPEVDMPQYVHNRIKGIGNYRDKPIVVDPEDRNALSPTVVAHYAKDMGTRLVRDRKSKYGVRPFTIREYARLQGVPEDIKFEGNRSDYKLIGNGVPVPMARWVGNNLMRYFN